MYKRQTVQSLRDRFPGQKFVFLLSIMADKDVDEMLALLLPLAGQFVTVAAHTPRAMPAETLAEQIRARGGKIIAVIARDDTHVRRSADYTIEVPVVTDCLMPIVVSVPLQLLAYYIAVNKGRNVDQPRNLAKSVTVE